MVGSETYRVTREAPCPACGRTSHRVVILERGPRCAEANPLKGWEPADRALVRVNTDDGTWPEGHAHLVRARHMTGAKREALGEWAFYDAEGDYIDRTELSPTAIRYLPALAIAADDVERIMSSGGTVDREMLATSAANIASGLQGAVWTSNRDKGDGLAIAAAAMRIAAELLPEVYGTGRESEEDKHTSAGPVGSFRTFRTDYVMAEQERNGQRCRIVAPATEPGDVLVEFDDGHRYEAYPEEVSEDWPTERQEPVREAAPPEKAHEVKPRDVTGASWSIDDAEGDSLVIYTPQPGACAIGVQRRGRRSGFAAVLDKEALDAVLQELQQRRERMPPGDRPELKEDP